MHEEVQVIPKSCIINLTLGGGGGGGGGGAAGHLHPSASAPYST